MSLSRRSTAIAVLAVFIAAGGVLAEDTPASKSSTPAKDAVRAELAGQLVNVRIDVAITDQRSGQPAVSKSVSLTVADGQNGMVRSSNETPIGTGALAGSMTRIPLHIDAQPRVEGGKIRLGISLEYSLVDRSVSGEKAPERLPQMDIRESLSLVLESGRPMVVAESADPVSDRKVILEVKATILR